MQKLQLSNGFELPILGYGVYQIDDLSECKRGVASALDDGYRLIDTAACYGNGRAVGDALSEAAIPREEVSLSSKVWIQQNGYEGTMQSFEKTLMNLQTDYLDLSSSICPMAIIRGLGGLWKTCTSKAGSVPSGSAISCLTG